MGNNKPVVLNGKQQRDGTGPMSYFGPEASGVRRGEATSQEDRFAGNSADQDFELPQITKTMKLSIEHVPTGSKIEFPAFLTGFSDAYNSEWTSEQVYGRMDPIATFANTRRALSLSWVVPAASGVEAKFNMNRINAAIAFLYPMYTDQGGVNKGAIMNMGPLWKIKFGNLVQNASDGEALMGYVNGLTMDPELDMGMFTFGGTGDSMEYYPKAVRLNVEMVVLHQHNMGWSMNGEAATLRGGSEGFPYKSDQPLTTASTNDIAVAAPSPDNNTPGNSINQQALLS